MMTKPQALRLKTCYYSVATQFELSIRMMGSTGQYVIRTNKFSYGPEQHDQLFDDLYVLTSLFAGSSMSNFFDRVAAHRELQTIYYGSGRSVDFDRVDDLLSFFGNPNGDRIHSFKLTTSRVNSTISTPVTIQMLNDGQWFSYKVFKVFGIPYGQLI